LMLKRGWLVRHLDSRALGLTAGGLAGLSRSFGFDSGK